jgi:hypothetical protein
MVNPYEDANISARRRAVPLLYKYWWSQIIRRKENIDRQLPNVKVSNFQIKYKISL